MVREEAGWRDGEKKLQKEERAKDRERIERYNDIYKGYKIMLGGVKIEKKKTHNGVHCIERLCKG